MSVPMRPGLNARRFADTLWMLKPERPLLSADSALWKDEHGVAPNDRSTNATAKC